MRFRIKTSRYYVIRSSVNITQITNRLLALNLFSMSTSLISLYKAPQNFLTCERISILLPNLGRLTKGLGNSRILVSLPPKVHSASTPN